MHDVRTMDELHGLEKSGGALHAFLEAKASGLTAHIGVTGHHDPNGRGRSLASGRGSSARQSRGAAFGGLLDEMATVAAHKGMAVIGMKV